MAELLAAVTGWNTSSYEIMRYGERRNHLMRVYNLREGLSAADDRLPDRFFDDPFRKVSGKANVSTAQKSMTVFDFTTE